MANRSWLPPAGYLEVDVVGLFGSITFGATGAVASSTGKGTSTVVRNSAGRYTITLTDSYNAFMSADLTTLDAAASDPTTAGLACKLVSQAVSNSSTPTVVVQFYTTSDGSAVDPASGAQLFYRVDVRNSSVS